MEIDTLGTFTASRAAFPELRRSGGGVVINISATLHYGATWWQVRFEEEVLAQLSQIDVCQCSPTLM